VTARTLQAVLRSLSAVTPALTDGELVRRHLAGDEEAFAELVRRHSRLVWSVCRYLTRSDDEAEDAFQATFLVLLKNAAKIRDSGRISAWLHGVAYRICSKARVAANRRTARERAAAVSERNGHAVADSAWDRALAVVHEEVGRLPEALRVPFVLCCLEGKGATEAAQQLGWKLGTLSGRLTRAKDALLARLEARGLTLGAIAGLGLAVPPASALAKAVALPKLGMVIPVSILQLSQGVIGMSAFSFKLLAAGVLVACGLGVGVGSNWVSTADAQTPGKAPPSKSDPSAEVKRLQDDLDKTRLEAERIQKALQDHAGNRTAQDLLDAARQKAFVEWEQADLTRAIDFLVTQQRDPKETYTAKTTKWEYDFVEVSDMDQTKFMKFLQDRENRGWEYNGTTTLKDDGRKQDIWVFRRPAGGAADSWSNSRMLNRYFDNLAPSRTPDPGIEIYRGLFRDTQSVPVYPPPQANAVDPKAIEAEIARLQERLARLKAKPNTSRVVIDKKDLPLPPADVTELLLKLASKKFKNAHYSIAPTDAGIIVEGDKEVLNWAAEMVKNLGGN
jgi:RNA polymerase sigma factor (sigma-70 family)